MTAAEYRAIRKGMGLTQQQLADHLGVSKKTISSREAGKARITAEMEAAIKALASGAGEDRPRFLRFVAQIDDTPHNRAVVAKIEKYARTFPVETSHTPGVIKCEEVQISSLLTTPNRTI